MEAHNRAFRAFNAVLDALAAAETQAWHAPRGQRRAAKKRLKQARAEGGTIATLAQLDPCHCLQTGTPMSTTAHTGSRTSAARGLESAIDDITAFGAAAARDAKTAARDAKAGIDDVVADVSEKSREAMQGAREVRDTVSDAILDSIKKRPYTTLAIAGFIGFLYGAMRRR